MRKCPDGTRMQRRAVRRFKLESQRHNSEANHVERQLTLCHIMAYKAVVRVVIAGVRDVSRNR